MSCMMQVRKLFVCWGFGQEAVFLLAVAYSSTTDANVAMTFLALAGASSALADAGYSVNLLDIAPRYSAVLPGISNGLGNVAGKIMPFHFDPLPTNKQNKIKYCPSQTITNGPTSRADSPDPDGTADEELFQYRGGPG